MKRRWRPGDPDRRKSPRDVSVQMEVLAQEVIESAADLRQVIAALAALEDRELRRGG